MTTAMKRYEITVDGTAYPFVQTMGAMLRFKDVTGKDFSEFDASKTSDTVAWIWCCAVSGSKREGKQFPLSMEEMADLMTVEDMNDCLHAVSSANADDGVGNEDGEKKRPV